MNPSICGKLKAEQLPKALFKRLKTARVLPMGWHIPWIISAAAFACLAIGGCANTNDQRAKPLTRIEEQRLSADELKARVLHQLGNNLLPFAPVRSNSPRAESPLWQLHFATRPHTAYESGACTMEVITVNFVPAVAEPASADTPMRAVGIHSEPAFLFLPPPHPDPGREMTPAEMETEQAACAGIDPQDPRFVHASRLDIANDGMKLYRAAIEAIVSGNPPFEASCPEVSNCSELAKLANEENVSISPCSHGPEFGGCYQIYSNVVMQIFLGGAASQWKIAKVILVELVVVTSG